MDQRAGIGLGHDQRGRRFQEGADFWRRRHAAAGPAQNAHVGIGQDAEPGIVAPFQRLALAAGQIVVFAAAEEDEIVVAQPFEQPGGFLEGGLQIRVVEARGLAAQRLDGFAGAVAHGIEIGIGVGDLAEDRLEPGLERRVRVAVAQGIDGELDQAGPVGFAQHHVAGMGGREAGDLAGCAAQHVEDRMGDVADADGGIGDLGGHRVEQERHVVADDGDQFQLAPVAQDEAVRLFDAHQMRAPAVIAQRLEAGAGRQRQSLGRELGQILGRRAGKEQRGEGGFGAILPDGRLDRRQDLRLGRCGMVHGVPSDATACRVRHPIIGIPPRPSRASGVPGVAGTWEEA